MYKCNKLRKILADFISDLLYLSEGTVVDVFGYHL